MSSSKKELSLHELTKDELAIHQTNLANQRTDLANQRTYLSYMRTGFVIAGFAGTLKKWWIVAFGILMIIGSVLQYSIINYNLSKNIITDNTLLDMLPIIYVILSLGALYLQMKKHRL
jgi:uncharacterized membrane protein YidH (DUF202 family)